MKKVFSRGKAIAAILMFAAMAAALVVIPAFAWGFTVTGSAACIDGAPQWSLNVTAGPYDGYVLESISGTANHTGLTTGTDFPDSGGTRKNYSVTATWVKPNSGTWHSGYDASADENIEIPGSTDTKGPYTFSHDGSNSYVDVNFHDSDKQVTITALAGYSISFVGIDYTGSDANEVTFGPVASPFNYDAPGYETVDHVTVTLTKTGPSTWKHRTWDRHSETLTGHINKPTCYTVCDETTTLAKVYGPVVDVGSPVWGAWVDNGDGTFTKTGTQATTQHWTQDIVDKYDQKHICGQLQGDDPGSREVKETKDGSFTYSGDGDCFFANLYRDTLDPDGAVVVDDELIDQFAWVNKFQNETHTFEGYDVTVVENTDCQATHEVVFAADQQCERGWSWTLYLDGELLKSDSGAWTDAYNVEHHDYNVNFLKINGQLYDNPGPFQGTIYEGKDCQHDPEVYRVLQNDCVAVRVAILDENDEIVVEASKSWVDPYGPESFSGTLDYIDLNGQEQSVPFYETKDEGCIQCKVTPVYPMAAYIVNDAPPGYWQGPFGMGPGVCAVIHPEGQVPSADRVTVICSLCENQIPKGFIYDVREGNGRMFYDDYVYRVSCYGEKPFYVYGGFNWDNLVRTGDFTHEGERICLREEGCADWIKEQAGITTP